MENNINPPIFYISPDPLRALGLEKIYDNYHIVCTMYSPLVDQLLREGVSVFCLEKEVGRVDSSFKNSRKLLLHERVQEFMIRQSEDLVNLLFFKPTFDINLVLQGSPLASQRELRLLQVSAREAKVLENKLNLHEFAYEAGVPVPQTQNTPYLADTSYESIVDTFETPFVIQLEHGWSGKTTFFINNEDEFKNIQEKYKTKPAKLTSFVKGHTLTVNAVVSDQDVFQTYPFLQLSGAIALEHDLADHWGSSVGNFWGSLEDVIHDVDGVVDAIQRFTELMGKQLRSHHFKGFIGFDYLVSESGKVYLQEMNPRFTASTQMITQLEQSLLGSSLLEEHLVAYGFDGRSKNVHDYRKQLHGLRIIARNTKNKMLAVVQDVNNGIYTMSSDKELTFEANSYTLDELSPHQLLIFTASKGDEVAVGDELLQIQTLGLGVEDVIYAAKKIKKQLISTE